MIYIETLFNHNESAAERRRHNSSAVNAMQRQEKFMSFTKRERWTEAQVLAFPKGEHDYFDRKSGRMMDDQNFRKDLAKAVCAFANSTGGHLLLGVKNDGTFDGVEPKIGRQPTREWLEQIIPEMLSYPLEDFRVHGVEPDPVHSEIPAGKIVIVIDVGDSVLAPHQATEARQYYYREAGHSKLAPHFYVEMLRNRLTSPTLEAKLVSVDLTRAYGITDANASMVKSRIERWHGGGVGVFFEIKLRFRITNAGRVASYKWKLVTQGVIHKDSDYDCVYVWDAEQFPYQVINGEAEHYDAVILPSLSVDEEVDLGIFFMPLLSPERIRIALGHIFPDEIALRYRVITETSRGETEEVKLDGFIKHRAWVDKILRDINNPS